MMDTMDPANEHEVERRLLARDVTLEEFLEMTSDPGYQAFREATAPDDPPAPGPRNPGSVHGNRPASPRSPQTAAGSP